MNTKRFNLTHLNRLLIFILLASGIMYLGKTFLVPLAIAVFFAMLLFPVARKLQQRGVKKPTAALYTILLLLAVLGLLHSLVYYQVSQLQRDLPRLEEKIEEKTNRLQWLLYQTTDIPEYEQEALLAERKPDIIKAIGKGIKNLTLEGLYLLLTFFIILTYTFFFLVYRHKIHNFLLKLHLFDHPTESRIMLLRVAEIAHHYLKGTFTVISVLAIIYALGFWAIGLEHALLFALITALLRIIPYFGSFLGIAFPIAFAFVTKDSGWYPVLILIFFMVTQLLEANLLTPYITGSRVKLNPLATIMVILFGNLLWGVPGMIIFVPLFGILKIFFDQIPQLNPYGYMLGNEEENIT